MAHESLKEWQESHHTSNPKLAKKHGIKLVEHAKSSTLKNKKEKVAGKMKDDVYGIARNKRMFESPEHKKAVAKGKAEEKYG